MCWSSDVPSWQRAQIVQFVLRGTVDGLIGCATDVSTKKWCLNMFNVFESLRRQSSVNHRCLAFFYIFPPPYDKTACMHLLDLKESKMLICHFKHYEDWLLYGFVPCYLLPVILSGCTKSSQLMVITDSLNGYIL